MKTQLIHIDQVQPGDCIQCTDGELRTINKSHIKRGGFMGTTIWGDSYFLGNIKVKKILFK